MDSTVSEKDRDNSVLCMAPDSSPHLLNPTLILIETAATRSDLEDD